MSTKSKSSLAVALLIVLAAIGIAVFQGNNDDQETVSNQESTSESTQATSDVSLTVEEDPATSTSAPAPGTSPEDPVDNVLTPLQGTQTGTAQLLLTSLNFPTATMTTEGDTFVLEASGLSLSLLGNQALQVNEVYPLVEVTASGAADIETNGVRLEVTSLVPNFYLEAEDGTRTPIDETTQTELVTALAGAGIAIPEVSETTPASLPVTVTDEAGSLQVTTTSDADFFARFQTN